MIGDRQLAELVKSEQSCRPVKTHPVAPPRLSLAGPGFHGLGCGNFPISVQLVAPGRGYPRTQWAALFGYENCFTSSLRVVRASRSYKTLG